MALQNAAEQNDSSSKICPSRIVSPLTVDYRLELEPCPLSFRYLNESRTLPPPESAVFDKATVRECCALRSECGASRLPPAPCQSAPSEVSLLSADRFFFDHDAHAARFAIAGHCILSSYLEDEAQSLSQYGVLLLKRCLDYSHVGASLYCRIPSGAMA